MDADWLQPQWDAPAAVGAVMSTRAGGVSAGPFASMNLGAYVGDEEVAVRHNMQRFADVTGARPVFMKQVHGTRVVNLDTVEPGAPVIEADASVTSWPGVACTVTVADCLPVLFAATNGRAVGAAHAGWRGLAGGVLEQTLAAVCQAAGCSPQEVVAWLGACIGPRAFEVGADVLTAFDQSPDEPDPARFTARCGADGTPRWLANLPQLARDKLTAAGVQQVSGGGWCTVEDPARFYSFRRDRVTGRMAAAVWLRGG
ncbi:peptidoglycan editing factor PgeF [Ideonella sp. BN130291]|uniref:peptidoglycan editing factor PgeF n=1 Tax=Ideonella sp. BN130291 TaxID=3112940 RepID=UPI002E25BD0F|nr:peptidoglycan editing factor PgeF [Ideonella sp. BN130291]